MKKITAIILLLILLLHLAGCGGTGKQTVPDNTTANQTEEPQPDNQSEEPQPADNNENNEEPPAAEPESQRIQSNDFSKGVIEKSIQNLIYQAPKSWREGAGDDQIKYYYPTSEGAPLMMVEFQESTKGVSIRDKGALSSYLDGFSSGMDDFVLSEQSFKKTSTGTVCGYLEFSGTIVGIEMDMVIAIFDCQGGFIIFSFGTPQDFKTDYTNDFYSILNSVEVIEDLTQGEVGNYYVAIGDCAFAEDYHGNNVIVISYDFTNNSDETVTPLWELSTTAFQDGIELDIAFVFDNSVYDAGIAQKKIRPGVTLTGCQEAYVLISDSPVEFEVGPLFGDPVLEKVFDVN